MDEAPPVLPRRAEDGGSGVEREAEGMGMREVDATGLREEEATALVLVLLLRGFGMRGRRM